MAEITPEMQQAANVIPIRFGKGRTVHYATADRSVLVNICGYRTLYALVRLTAEEADKLGKECVRCVHGVNDLAGRAPAVHRYATTREAYDAAQQDGVRDGDVLVVEPEGVVGFVTGSWPVAITAEHGDLHLLTVPARSVENGHYAASADTAERIAREIGAALPAAGPTPLDEALNPTPATGAAVADRPQGQPRYLADYTVIDSEGDRAHRITVTRQGSTAPELVRELPYDVNRRAARTLEALGWEIVGMETYGGPHFLRAWVTPVLTGDDLPFHGPDSWAGPQGICGHDDHTVPLEGPDRAAVHPRTRGVLGACPGSLRPVRTHREQETSRHTAALSYTRPRPSLMAWRVKPGDILDIDGQALIVEACHPIEPELTHMHVTCAGRTEPLIVPIDAYLTTRRRVRIHEVYCQECGIVALVDTDEAVDGAPIARLCGMCDGAEEFSGQAPAAPVLTAAFQVEAAPAGCGAIAGAGSYGKGSEPTRSDARMGVARAAERDQQSALPTLGGPVVAAAERRVVEGVVVQHGGDAEGCAPCDVEHPDVVAARRALDGLKAARLADHHDIDEPTEEQQDVRGYVIKPRGHGWVSVYWLEGGKAVRHGTVDGTALSCLADRFRRRGCRAEEMLRFSTCLVVYVPQEQRQG
ncbi:hypothetical protein [Streptomyces sp. NPDC087272]|uniref:hypothetical protein n=1 Tax=Streptomyces sp. NPDC087272 TaxID=3365775 RepID=UPI00380FCEB5